MVKLSPTQLDRLRFLGYSDRGALGGTRQATIDKLMTLGFIRNNGRFFRSYVITPEGIDHLLSVNPNSSIHIMHMGPVIVGARVIHKGRYGVVRKIYNTANDTVFGGIVSVEFDDNVITEEMISFRELETSAPRSEVHFTKGFDGRGDSRSWTRLLNGKLYRFSVVNMPNGEVRWFVIAYNGYVGGPKFHCAWSPVVSRTFTPEMIESASNNWHPTTIRGTDEYDPILTVLGCSVENGESVVWVAFDHIPFSLTQRQLERYYTANPPVFTRWIVTRMSTNSGASEFDRAMASKESHVVSSRGVAYVVLQRMLREELIGWSKMNMVSKRDELLLIDTIDHPTRNRFERDGVRWTIRGW